MASDFKERIGDTAGELIKRQQLLGWLIVAGTAFMVFIVFVAGYLGIQLLEYMQSDLKSQKSYQEELYEMRSENIVMNTQGIAALERNSKALESLVSMAEINRRIFTQLLLETTAATKETRRTTNAIEKQTQMKSLKPPDNDKRRAE